MAELLSKQQVQQSVVDGAVRVSPGSSPVPLRVQQKTSSLPDTGRAKPPPPARSVSLTSNSLERGMQPPGSGSPERGVAPPAGQSPAKTFHGQQDSTSSQEVRHSTFQAPTLQELRSAKGHHSQDSISSISSRDSGNIILISSNKLETSDTVPAAPAGMIPTAQGVIAGGMLNMSEYSGSGSRSYAGRDADRKSHNWTTCKVTDWSVAQVCQWLMALELEQYIPEFSGKNVDGNQLLMLDSSKLKSLGVTDSNDRAKLKKRIKDVRAGFEKEKKREEKEQKAREKQMKKQGRKTTAKC
ncbi:PREDICTED: uncharacterized protein LOC106821010 [Priapulus caudatus]|uniref:Uncharacterized protein LOC106821010 n=1 Tax=Priapulus caudatus TaxID=37621 RepID=A0ABM1F9K9_PRICU|nr:PREDICTED: uncharacterized protein LOC106821010 [Priapulus caudatus]